MKGENLDGDGLLVIDKPRGPSSHQVTAWVSRLLGRHSGHAGTLDPGVSGVLVVMLGKSTRLAPILLAEDKEYVCALRTHGNVSSDQMNDVLLQFTGRIYQRPPRKSAVARNLRIRTVHSIELLDSSRRVFLLRISCDAGTYIRTLCHHIGLVLGTGAHMEELRRSRSGVFGEREAVTLHQLSEAVALAHGGAPASLEEMIRPPSDGLGSTPRILVRDTAVDAVCHGAILAVPGMIRFDEFQQGATVAMFTSRGEFIGLGTALIPSQEASECQHGVVVAPGTVFMDPGTYPRGWKKKGIKENHVPLPSSPGKR
jgi:H/ACA ribonucleoprotein complex subunit 4